MARSTGWSTAHRTPILSKVRQSEGQIQNAHLFSIGHVEIFGTNTMELRGLLPCDTPGAVAPLFPSRLWSSTRERTQRHLEGGSPSLLPCAQTAKLIGAQAQNLSTSVFKVLSSAMSAVNFDTMGACAVWRWILDTRVASSQRGRLAPARTPTTLME